MDRRDRLRPDASFEELRARVLELEELLFDGLRVEHLPLKELYRKLEEEMRPEGDIFLMPRTVGRDSLKPSVINAGIASVFFNGTAVSNDGVIFHGLGVVPAAIIATGAWAVNDSHMTAWTVRHRDQTTFTVRGRSVNGAAIGPGNMSVLWVAVGAPDTQPSAP